MSEVTLHGHLFRTALISCAAAMAILVSAGQPKSAERGGITVKDLARGDTLLVDFRSWGCNAFPQRAEIALSGAAPTHAAIRHWFVVGDRPPEVQAAWVALADSDRARLDRLLEYYRTPRPTGCTLWHEVTFRLLARGKVVQQESYYDGSCGWRKVPGIRTIEDLLQRAVSPRPK